MANESEFKLKYNVPDNEIDSQTLVESLIGITNIIQEANKYLDPSKRINIRVKALGTGSFIVHLELLEASIIDAIKSLFSPDVVSYLANLATITAFALGYVGFKKLSKKITERDNGETLTLENPDGNSLTIEKPLYQVVVNNQIIIASAEKTLKALAENEALSGFEILRRDDSPMYEILRPELLAIAAAIEEEEEEISSRIVTKRVILGIVKPSFERRYKWDFAYLGIRISASVTDNDFLDRVERGEERFASGDALECDLQIGEEYVQKLRSYVGRGYEVVKVIQHIPKTNPQLSIEP